MHWEPGRPIIARSIQDGLVGSVRSLTVVADTTDLLALYVGPGYPRKIRAGTRGGPRNRVLLHASGQHDDAIWVGGGALILYQPGDAHSTYLFHDPATGKPSSWYIDLHEPLRRTPLGVDTRDHILDARVAIDRRAWEWKDEDELAWHQAAGLIPLPPEEVLRAEGLRAITRLTKSAPPLYAEWERWSPDPAWPTPAIPNNWREIVPSPIPPLPET